VEASTERAQIESFNPATGERLGSVAATDPAEVPRIVAEVAEVQPFWAQLRLEDRGRYMRRAAQVIIDHLDDLATLITQEQGRPRVESYSLELVPSVDVLHWLAENGPKLLRDHKVRASQPFSLQRRAVDAFDPLGAVAVTASEDEPWARPFADVAFALMAGNGVVVRPSPLAPLVGQRIQRVLERAGLPDGIVRTVQGDARADGVAKTFHGPGAGGAGTHIVLAEAGLQSAIDGCLWAGGRVYVAREIAERFTDGLVEAAGRLRVGDPMSWDTDVGPVASEARFAQLTELVEGLLAGGATLRCGGPTDPPRYYAPAVLTGGTPADVPRPVVQVIAVQSEEDALAQPLGLNVSIWTRDRAKGERMARRIRADAVGVNHLPAAGTRRLHDYVAVKRIASDPGRTRDFRWYPYDEGLGTAFHSAVQLLYGRDEDKRAALQRGAVPLAKLGRKALRRAGGRH
jgi:acyl-CoA reductase-like NAD-dependent aldehyde dehydrogenase